MKMFFGFFIWFLVGLYSRVLQSSPWNPASQPAKHVPFTWKHLLVSAQFPQFSEQLAP